MVSAVSFCFEIWYNAHQRKVRELRTFITKLGDGLGIRLSKASAESLGLHEGDMVDIRQEEGKITLKKSKTAFKNYDTITSFSPTEQKEIDWGKDVGAEKLD